METPPNPIADDMNSCIEMKPSSECSAQCNPSSTSKENYYVKGSQRWENDCDPVAEETRDCHVACSAGNYEIAVPQNIKCPEEPWSECTSKCVQTKKQMVWKKNECKHSGDLERKCYASQCPTEKGSDAPLHTDMPLLFILCYIFTQATT